MRHPKILLACLAVARNERRAPSTVASRRAAYAAQPDPRLVDQGDGLSVEQHEVAVDGGCIEVTLYRVAGVERRPVHLIFHGGGFCYGGPKDVDLVAREYAIAIGGAAASVRYRLAPEHPWPVPVEDGYAALRWVADRADGLGLDPGRISIGGVSAGGCVAAVVTLMARDRGGPAVVFQLLEIPVIDLTMGTGTSLDRFGRGRLLTSAHLADSYALYVPDPLQRRHPYASPIHAEDLSGLPPTLIATAEQDPLRDEGEAYGQRLRAAGVPTQVVRARGHVHASHYSALPSAERYRAVNAAVLARAHGAATPG